MKNKTLSRRTFLAYLGTGAVTIAAASTGLGAFTGSAAASDSLFDRKTGKVTDAFTPIEPGAGDELVLPKGFRHDVLVSFGDPINGKGDTFGYNNEFTRFFPFDDKQVNGLLWVNHASVHPLLALNQRQQGPLGADQVKSLLYGQGASVVEAYRDREGKWKINPDSAYARRITGYDRVELAGPARGTRAVKGAGLVQGTFGNGAGSVTPWGTVLSCEGDFESTCGSAGLELSHYGWVVEADPFDGSFKVRKHTALGRFHHGQLAVTLSKDGRVVVYMGDTTPDSCLYKFVSAGKLQAASGKANADLLTEGTLYAADLVDGRWVPLTIEAVKNALNRDDFQVPFGVNQIKEVLVERYKEQADVLVYAQDAALILGATPTDRPAGLAVHAKSGALIAAFPNNIRHGNIHGHLAQLAEQDGDAGAAAFDYEVVSNGGRGSGYSSPGTLLFDDRSNLWVASDIPADKLNQGAYAPFRNNGLYVVRTAGQDSAAAQLFASAPVEAAFTGPCFTADERTLFLSVSHPGQATVPTGKPTSLWPHRSGDSGPRPSVVAISGFA
ncbi:PhoX family protein [Paenibacillus ehimensis]|uniref:PhoX family protein n=1 Tax=Paenibacillus ehimensis TaxID=79264 RepID=UPI000FDB52A3|nr:alkaline phosphatase PhoX [Paenibacillus ehimensis]